MQSQLAVFHTLFAFVNSWLLFPVQCHKFTNEPLPTATEYCYLSSVLCDFAVFARNPVATNARIGFPAHCHCPLLPFFSVLFPFAVFARENSHQCTNRILCLPRLPTATNLAFSAPLPSLREETATNARIAFPAHCHCPLLLI